MYPNMGIVDIDKTTLQTRNSTVHEITITSSFLLRLAKRPIPLTYAKTLSLPFTSVMRVMLDESADRSLCQNREIKTAALHARRREAAV